MANDKFGPGSNGLGNNLSTPGWKVSSFPPRFPPLSKRTKVSPCPQKTLPNACALPRPPGITKSLRMVPDENGAYLKNIRSQTVFDFAPLSSFHDFSTFCDCSTIRNLLTFRDFSTFDHSGLLFISGFSTFPAFDISAFRDF